MAPWHAIFRHDNSDLFATVKRGYKAVDVVQRLKRAPISGRTLPAVDPQIPTQTRPMFATAA